MRLRRISRCLAVALVLGAGLAHATCDLVVEVPGVLQPADEVPWSGCGASGTGVQRALDLVAASGGGSVKLTGSGSLRVARPLGVGNGTTLYGDPARAPYGMVLVGENADGGCNPGPAYRDRDCPVIQVFGQAAAAPTAGGANITLYNLHIDGGTPGRPLNNAISVQQSRDVAIVYNRITGARWKGIEDANTVGTTIDNLWLEMVRRTGPEPEVGGAGVWFSRSVDATLRNSFITSPTYFATGVPDWDSRHGPDAAVTMDLVSALGTKRTRIVGNTIASSNTAGIYVAADLDARSTGAVVANNIVIDSRQHGIDLANCDGIEVTGNTVSNAGDAGISIADCHGGYFQGNVVSGAAANATYFMPRASFMLGWGSSGNTITGNEVRGSANAQYSIYVSNDPLYGIAANNAFTCNMLASGAMGIFGGDLVGKSIVALDRVAHAFRCRLPSSADMRQEGRAAR